MALILVVDDCEPVRNTLRRMLESRLHHQVLLAADGREALEAWRECGADLVMLDVHMPDVDGIELLMQFRALAPALPMIVMSGGDRTGRHDPLEKALLLGAKGALAKPFYLHQVLELVTRVLGPDQSSQTA
jgi:CheY-like chemotaxis protein